ncbi:MAG: hypothetical protein Q9N67_03175 [Ghiorsea sp.]|nr:hypothetical protein [Ghiorsea sp.]
MLILTPKPTYISRSAFQWILHQALVADERYTYRGLIGSLAQDMPTIQKVAMVKEDEDIQQTLDVWSDLDIQCLGFFHFEEDAASSELVDVMPDEYIELKVRLSEKGRLDLLAYHCNKSSESVEKINLDLIEDGQKDAVV